MQVLGKAENTSGVFRRLARLAGTIVTSYRNHFALFWRIMMPVVILVILFDIVMFFYHAKHAKAHEVFLRNEGLEEFKDVSDINTFTGISYPTNYPPSNHNPGVSWAFAPSPTFKITSDDGVIWTWYLKFRSFEHSLLLLTICPLAFAVAQLYRHPQITMRDAWREAGRRHWAILGVNLLLILIFNAFPLLYGVTVQFIPWIILNFMPFLMPLLIMVTIPQCFLLVTFSLYNQCLILENKSVIGVLRRSYELVKGSWWRFCGIYLVTAWIASVITSVFFGFAFLALSVVSPELVLVRNALLPVGFLTLFLGSNVEIGLGCSMSILTVIAILVVRGLISAFLVPIWATLTTYLYLEKSTGNWRKHVRTNRCTAGTQQ